MPGRNGRPRSKSGFGGKQLVFFSLASLVALSLTFALGMLVGRQWARSIPPLAQVEKGKKPGLTARSGIRDSQAERTGQMREKLTFYQDLSAPLAATPPPPSKPAAEPAKRPVKTDVPSSSALEPSSSPPPAPSPHPQAWVVQVGAYRAREPAEEFRRSLSAAGYDAYVTAVSTDDGTVRYRVRVGSFSSRSDAEKTASRLKAERSLNPFVTTKSDGGQ
jgi:cell division protein FtsN